MPKIQEVLGENTLPPLQHRVLQYLQSNKDEIYSYTDAEELSSKIGHRGSRRGVAFSLWALNQKGLIEKERWGRRVYFGSKEAIAEFRKHAKRQRKSDVGVIEPHIKDVDNIPHVVNLPRALAQILEMIHLVRKEGYSRIEATTEISRRRNIAKQTVLDKYCRQLGKTAVQIDDLLHEDGLTEFKRILKYKFSGNQAEIERFFGDLTEWSVTKSTSL